MRSGGPDAETIATHVRTVLVKSITFSRVPNVRPRPRTPIQDPSVSVVVDYADFRQRYVLVQQTAELEIDELCGRLRCLLAARIPDLARLTVLNVSIEQAPAGHGRSLLGAIPTMPA